jgi:signal transduction histidine kinase
VVKNFNSNKFCPTKNNVGTINNILPFRKKTAYENVLSQSNCSLMFFYTFGKVIEYTNLNNYPFFIPTNNINIAGFFLAVIIIIIFVIRESKVKLHYKKLKSNLQERIEKINLEEQKIRTQKEEIEAQINYTKEQNNLIHKQKIEPEKHRQYLKKIFEAKTAELKIAKEKAEESDRLKTAFLENMSHEIRTPMNAVIGFASLLNEASLSIEDRGKYISRISSNCHVLLRLIEDILDISKIHAEQMQINKSKFSVDKALTSLYVQFAREKEDLDLMKIELILDKEAGNETYFIYADEFRFNQIMSNLLSNALKYTETGSIHFGYKPLFNSEYEKEPSMLQFYIKDTGIGIPTEKSEFIFDRFSKIEDDTTKLYRGAGMGLFISKKLVNLMGGTIWVQSMVNEGSTFYFTLPYFDTGDSKQKIIKKETPAKSKLAKTYDWRNKIILIAEDEKNNFIYLNEIIKLTGAQTIEAKNGVQAVEIVKNNSQISLVLMDILMPDLDGYAATKKIKSIRPGLPIIAQTAYSVHKQKEKSLESGCDGYISKPYEPTDLLELISNFI